MINLMAIPNQKTKTQKRISKYSNCLSHTHEDTKKKKKRENEINKDKKERENEIKKRGNPKRAQEGTHAGVDSKRKKER